MYHICISFKEMHIQISIGKSVTEQAFFSSRKYCFIFKGWATLTTNLKMCISNPHIPFP